MKLLDRYILKKFLLIFGLCLLAFLVIFNIVDLIEKLDKFLKADMPSNLIALFYLYQLPYYLNLALPMALLLAAVFTIGLLSKHNELDAIKSSGISLYRVSIPLLITGILISIGSFFFEDAVVIPATRRRIDIEAHNMHRRKYIPKTFFTNIMYQDSPTCNIVIGNFSTKDNIAQNVTIQYNDQFRLVRRIDARKMVWLPDQQLWQLFDYKVRSFDQDGTEIVAAASSDTLIQLNLQPEDIVKSDLNPEGMRYRELAYFIKRLQESGNDARKWEVNKHFKLAFPFTNFIVILFGVPLAAAKPHKGIAFGAGMSLLAIFIYYGFIKLGQVLGYKGILSPLLAVWLGNIVFLIAGGYLLYKIRQ